MNQKKLPTKEKLARAIEEKVGKGVPTNHVKALIKRARAGYYDEFDGELATPLIQLVADLRQAGWPEMAQRVINGDFDASKEEADAWFAREGRAFLMEFTKPDKPTS